MEKLIEELLNSKKEGMAFQIIQVPDNVWKNVEALEKELRDRGHIVTVSKLNDNKIMVNFK